MTKLPLHRRLIRAVVPGSWRAGLRRRYFRVHWSGDYATWAEARAASSGYDAPKILEQVRAATARVRDGGGAFERDGIVFPTLEMDELLLACLRRAQKPGTDNLNVLDFGGSLGSAYWQHRTQLRAFGQVVWRVVEQPAFAGVGQREFAHDELRFFSSMEAACADAQPDVVLFGSVLPYIESPHVVLDETVARGVPQILIGRTGVIDAAVDRLTIQHVPPTIYSASYPCWFFSRTRLLSHFTPGYALWRQEPASDGQDSGFAFWNFAFEKRPQ